MKSAERFHQTLPRGDLAIADDDRFHVIGGGDPAMESRAKVNDCARHETADSRNDEPLPQRQFTETLNKSRYTAACQDLVNEAGRHPVCNGASGAQNPMIPAQITVT